MARLDSNVGNILLSFRLNLNGTVVKIDYACT